MASDITTENASGPAKKKGSLLLIIVVGLMATVAGGAAPVVYFKFLAKESRSDHHDAPVHGDDEDMIVHFGDAAVNLNEANMTRYLRLKIALLVSRADGAPTEERVEEKGAILRSWLISHLSDKRIDDIRGAAGQNALRREIREQFNEILFNDGRSHVRDIVFEEFNVQ